MSDKSLIHYQDSDNLKEENIFDPYLLNASKVFLGGEISPWREEVMDYFKDSGFEFIDPVDENWSEDNVYKELADLVNSTNRVFLRGGEGTKKEKTFLEETDLSYEEFEEIEEVIGYLKKIQRKEDLEDIVIDLSVSNPIEVAEDLEELVETYDNAIYQLQNPEKADIEFLNDARANGILPYFTKGLIKIANSYNHGCLECPVPEELSRYILKDIVPELDFNILRTSEQTLGIETESHITVLYGAGDGMPFEQSKSIIEKYFKNPIKVRSDSKISYFENDSGNVAIVKVFSEDIYQLREDLLEDMENASEFKEYVPHITIAYLNPGEKLPIEDFPVFEWEVSKLILSDKDGSTNDIYLGEEPEDYVRVLSVLSSGVKSEILSAIGQGLGGLSNGWLEDNDIYVHGRAKTKSDNLEDMGLVLTTQDMDVASDYSGYGDGKIYFFKKPAKYLDLSSRDSEDMDLVVERAITSDAFDDYIEYGVKERESEIERIVREAFAPKDIVDSAQGFDNPDFYDWFYDEFGSDYDFVETPDGGVILNSENVEYAVLPWDPDWNLSEFEEGGLEQINNYLKTSQNWADAYPTQIFLNNRDKFLGNLGDNEDYNDYANWRGSFYGVPQLRQRIRDMMNYPDSDLVEQVSDYNDSLYEKSEIGQQYGEIDIERGIPGKDVGDFAVDTEELEKPQIINRNE